MPDNSPFLEVEESDYALLSNPLLNKGLSFSEKERDDFHLHGLIPAEIATLAEEMERAYEALKNKSSDIEKYIYLRQLQDFNETLYYRLVTEHIEELMPIIYTPTVGLGCQLFSLIYRRPRGIFISYPNLSRIDKILENRRFDATQVIVVSDGEHILGLGDQGAGGMGIPIGKLALYTACGGISFASTLPILIDNGTDNPERLKDPLYVGYRHARIRGEKYENLIDAFVQTVKKRFPHVLLQWEDFAEQNAIWILEKYQDQLCTFNGDIQGTGAIVVAALLSALKITKMALEDQRIVIVGAGSAGYGTALLWMKRLMDQGLSEEKALSQIYLLDQKGKLLIDSRSDLLPFQKKFSKAQDAIKTWQFKDQNHITLYEVVNNTHPTALIGLSGIPKIFTQEIVTLMCKHVQRPIIFALSNPTSKSEASPVDLMNWTHNRAIISTGSPYPNIIKDGHPFRVDQANNTYIFPGMGLGITAVKSKRVTDKMFNTAAVALATFFSPTTENLLPPLSKIREVSLKIALAVAKEAVSSHLSDKPYSDDEIVKKVTNAIWTPNYLPYRRINS